MREDHYIPKTPNSIALVKCEESSYLCMFGLIQPQKIYSFGNFTIVLICRYFRKVRRFKISLCCVLLDLKKMRNVESPAKENIFPNTFLQAGKDRLNLKNLHQFINNHFRRYFHGTNSFIHIIRKIDVDETYRCLICG